MGIPFTAADYTAPDVPEPRDPHPLTPARPRRTIAAAGSEARRLSVGKGQRGICCPPPFDIGPALVHDRLLIDH